MFRSSLFLVPLLFWGCLEVYAGVYKWTDDKGNVHFGDRPPTVDAEEVRIPKAASSPSTTAKERNRLRQRMLEIYQEDRNKKKLEETNRKQEAKQLAKQCEKARYRLGKYTESNALYDKLPNGERRYLTEEEREKAIAELQAAIEKNCK